MKCNHQSIFKNGFNPELVCMRILEEQLCQKEFNIVNFIEIFWCELYGNYWIMMPFAMLILFIIFKYISITVEEYIAEAIQAISDKLGLSDSVSSITLLAAANGAADMMTVLVSSGTEGGISYNIGALYGGGLFICSAVLALCIIEARRRLRFNWMIIYRLIVFYMFATLMTIAFALFKWITWWGSLIMLALYLFLVAVVIIDDRIESKKHLSKSMDAGDDYNASHDDTKERDLHQLPSRIVSKIFDLHKKVVDSEIHDDVHASPDFHPPSEPVNSRNSHPHPIRMSTATMAYTINEHRSMTHEFRIKIDFAHELRNAPIEKRGMFGWVDMILEKPFLGLLYLTVLPCDKEQYSKRRCLSFCFPGMLFSVLIFTQRLNPVDFIIAFSLGAGLFMFFYFSLDEKNPPRYYLLINILGLTGGLMWTYLLVTTMIDLIECMGILLNLNKTFLGLTVLAIGSSIPDAITTITLCKQSESIMALSGAYSGQLFALTVAFGLSMLKLTLTRGPQEFDLFDPAKLADNSLNILVIFTNLFVLAFTFCYSIRKRFKLEKSFGVILLIIYILFIITACVIGIRYAILYF